MAGDANATFAVVAKDSATKVLRNVGRGLGNLQNVAKTAFKALAAGAVAAGAAIAALAVQSIKAAAEDEQSTIRLNAALKARGFAVAELTPLINEQIKSAQRLGFTDDQVRAALETGSRFFKDRTTLMSSLSVAENIAAATGKDLSDVQMILGKAVLGQTRGLKTLGIEVKKGATAQDIFTAANAKYAGIAEDLANSTAGKFTAAQITFSEQIESLGYRLLPAVSDAMTFLSTNVLPITDGLFKTIGDTLTEVAGEISKPDGMLDSVGKVAGEIYDNLKPSIDAFAATLGPLFTSVKDLIGALWGDGDGALAGAFRLLGDAIKVAFDVAKPFFDFLKWLVDNLTKVIEGMNALGANKNLNNGFTPSYGPVQPGGNNQGGGFGGNYGINGRTVMVTNDIKFGNDAVSYIDTKLGTKYSYGGSRTNP